MMGIDPVPPVAGWEKGYAVFPIFGKDGKVLGYVLMQDSVEIERFMLPSKGKEDAVAAFKDLVDRDEDTESIGSPGI